MRASGLGSQGAPSSPAACDRGDCLVAGRLTSPVGDVAAHAHLLDKLGEHAVLLLCPHRALQGLVVLLELLQALEGAAASLPRMEQSKGGITRRSPAHSWAMSARCLRHFCEPRVYLLPLGPGGTVGVSL